jgi:hypothetical protein
MNSYIVAIIIYCILVGVGSSLSMLTSLLKCGKLNMYLSVGEGIVWSTLPAAMYLLTKWSPAFLSIFSEPIKGFSASLTDNGAEIIATGYIMMLASWIMTTRMIHTTEIAVCKPSNAELAKFKADLEKELKEKEANKPQE